MAKAKKEKYIPKVGITGVGQDYTIYEMSKTEKLIGFLIGLVAGFAAAQVMFGVILVSLLAGVGAGVAAVPIYRNHLKNKRTQTMRLQFRDLLDSLSNSFSSGKNTPDAFADAYNDMKVAVGVDAPMVQELAIIQDGLYNNFLIEDLLRDLAERCGLDDINSFAETFAVCNRLGGNLKKIVTDSRDIISGKIEIEMEIQTTVAGNKNQINVMCIMPFVIIAMMRTMGQEALTANNLLNIIVKLVALVLFAGAYVLGQKMTDIKV